MLHSRTMLTFALVLATLAGRLSDRTTGQPLPDVSVSLSPGHHSVKTDAGGRFTIAGLKAGTYTLTFESNDVPAQTDVVKLRSGQRRVLTVTVCTTSLDYRCDPGGSAEGGGG